MIYFIRRLIVDEETKFCDQQMKIGFTKGDPDQTRAEGRLKKLQTGCPDKLYLCAVIAGDKRVEKSWHNRFREERVRKRSEWFRLTSRLEEAIHSAVISGAAGPPEIVAINPPIETVYSFTLPPLPYDPLTDTIDVRKIWQNITDVVCDLAQRQQERFRFELNKIKGRLF